MVSIWCKSFPERNFPRTIVLLFIDISTAILTLTEKLVKSVKNLLKTLALEVLFTGLFTLLKIRVNRFGMLNVA